MEQELSEILKSSRFDVDPNAPGAIKLFKHWLKTLENLLELAATYARAQAIEEPNRFEVLCAFVGTSIYKLIEDCTDYDAAMLKLQLTTSNNLMSFSRDICYSSHKETKIRRIFAGIFRSFTDSE